LNDPWATLDDELKACQDDGIAPMFWWRDDDATRPTGHLDRLVRLSETYLVPLVIAAVPEPAEPELASWLAECPLVRTAQHGFRHHNHEPDGAKKSEYGESRTEAEMIAEIRAGWSRLDGFSNRVPVFVPPWNRLAASGFEAVRKAGLVGVSGFKARLQAEPIAGLKQVNTHVDVIEWRGHRGFVGEGKALADIVEHLAAKRQDTADPGEPTGLLTHHLDHDEATWAFVEKFLLWTRERDTVKWPLAADVFGLQ